MKTPLLFAIMLFYAIHVNAQFNNYYLYSFPFQNIFEPNEEVPFVTFSMSSEDDYVYIETKVCKYKKVRIDFCLCWDPEFQIIDIIEESGEPCERVENQIFEEEYFSNFEVDSVWYYWNENLENGSSHFHLTGSLVPGQPYITYTDRLMKVDDQNNSSKFDIYPNPVDRIIYFSETIKEAVIFSLTGEILMRIENPVAQLDISQLDSGNYIIKAKTSKGQFISQKVVKK